MQMISPGVYTREVDLTDAVASIATSSAALVGYSAKGSTDSIVLITNNQQFLREYGEPDPSTGHYFHYAALAYLAQGNTLWCLRVENGALYGGADIMYAGSSESNAGLAVGKSVAEFGVDSGLETEVLFQIVGINPGVWNDKLGVRIENVKDGTDPVVEDQFTFDIVVYLQDNDGNYAEVERWNVSRQSKLDGNGRQLYLEDKVNARSTYIQVLDNTDIAETVLPKEQATTLALSSGNDGSDITAADVVNGWDEFANPDDVDIRILINGGETDVSVHQKMIAVAESRLDCIAVLDMPWESTASVVDMVTYRTTTLNANSSYAALWSPWVSVFDSYNDRTLDVPPSGHVAGQMAYTDFVGNPWDAPAGTRRGRLNVLDVPYVFSPGERDTLYPQQINMIQKFTGEGNVLWGQKTLQRRFSALSSINVRRSLIVMTKSMAVALRSFVDENNTAVTRFRVTALLETYLSRLAAQGAFQTELDEGFIVQCDERNNPPEVIDNLEMRVDVFLKPVRAAEFIRLSVINTPTGASFEETIVRGLAQ